MRRNVRQRAEDPGAVDVEDGVPPPRAAPPLLRRVVLNCFHDFDHSPGRRSGDGAFCRVAVIKTRLRQFAGSTGQPDGN